jgi:hypothetical protein
MKLRTFCILTSVFCLLYLLTLTSVHTYDALSYVLDVDRKPWRELFHPHHLAYGPLGALIRAAASGLGWAGSAERLLQAANALAGALGAALFTAVVRRATGRTAAGLSAALLLASSYAYWYYAVEVEVYTIAALFLVLALGLMLALARRPAPMLAALLGLAQAGAVLFHQTNVLLCAAALVALACGLRAAPLPSASPPGWRRALALLAAYGLPLALVVGGAYLWVGLGVSGFRSWDELYRWLAGYTLTGFWGGPVGASKLALLGEGLAGTLAQPGGAVVGLALLAALLVNWRRLAAAPPGSVLVALTWLAVYGAFFLWWEPDNVEFWIASLPPFFLLVALAVWGGERPGREAAPDPAPPLARLWPAVVVTCGAAMLVVNGASILARGDAGRDLQRVEAAAVAARSDPGDLIVAPDGLPELYLPFYEARPNVFSLSQAMTAAGGDWPAACELIRGRADEALAAGYAVLVAADAVRPPPAPPGEPATPAERFGLTPDTVAACYAPLLSALEPLPLGPALGAYYRIAPARELAAGAGWDFTRSDWGWRATNSDPATSDLPGWALRPLADPAISSPPLNLDAARFGAVEVRLAAGTAARDAQLFFLDAGGQADEARSVRWTLAPADGPTTYRLDLRSAPGWSGTITGLRLDPVGAGDGGTVVLESIRLLP